MYRPMYKKSHIWLRLLKYFVIFYLDIHIFCGNLSAIFKPLLITYSEKSEIWNIFILMLRIDQVSFSFWSLLYTRSSHLTAHLAIKCLIFFTRYQDEILKSSCDFRNTQEKNRWKAENAYVENNLFSTIISASKW